MKIRIMTAARDLASGEAKEVVLPGEDGELTVMDFHQPCLCRLKAGMVRVMFRQDGMERKEKFLIKGGVVRVGFEGVALFVEEQGRRVS
jgi:F-type H+-transporting ATPase subunit epsilon